jgi:hypothetical protein
MLGSIGRVGIDASLVMVVDFGSGTTINPGATLTAWIGDR